MYEKRKLQLQSRIPDTKIKVARTQIIFAGKRGFAFVSFNPCRKRQWEKLCPTGWQAQILTKAKSHKKMPFSGQKKV